MTSSLIIVGSGIKFLSHLSVETKAQIEQSQKVLYLFNDPAMELWIQKQNPNTESLDPLYNKCTRRRDSYRAITDYILEVLQANQQVCVVLYGHPTVFAQSGLAAAQLAKEKNYFVKVLPAISAEDCLFADLFINPGSCWCQSFEATDFLIHQRIFDPSSHLILWQVGIIGVTGHARTINNVSSAKVLINYLKKWYPSHHTVVLYEAAQYPGFEPRIDSLALQDLPYAAFSRISTLYIPPIKKAACDKDMIASLGMNIEDLQ